jgi:hypothetical protein
MMADSASTYRKVHSCLWADRRFRELSAPPPSAQVLWFYLLTGEHLDILPGLARAGEAQLAEALGWSLEAFRACWSEIETRGMARADWRSRVVWLPNAVRYNAPENPNQVRGWARAWAAIPECGLKDEARETLRLHMIERGGGFLEALNAACPASRPEPSGERFAEPSGERYPGGSGNQEQDQEQELHLQSPPATAGVKRRKGGGKGKESDPRHAPFVAEANRVGLEVLGEAPTFDGSDGKALAVFLRQRPEVTVEAFSARWRRSLSAPFHRCARVRELVAKWGHHAGVATAAPGVAATVPRILNGLPREDIA